MDEGLLAEVLGRFDTDQSVDDDAGFLVFAACTGEAELDAVPGGVQIERPALPDVGEQPEPSGAYLQSISVESFRGMAHVPHCLCLRDQGHHRAEAMARGSPASPRPWN